MTHTQNNVKKNKRFAAMMAAAIITLSGAAAMLTGCGTDVGSSSASPSSGTASAVEGTTTAATTNTDSKPVNTTSAKKAENAQASDTTSAAAADTNTTNVSSDTEDDNIGVDRATAVSNVRAQAGSGAEIISVTKGTSPEGFKCWVIEVAPITNGSTPETVTYYSGYQFCYPESGSSSAASGSGQNPVMNYIGKYTNGRAMMTVSCIGKDQASIEITWSGSAFEGSTWTMSGPVTSSDEGVTISFSNCVKQSYSYSADGVLLSDTTDYKNGNGSVFFSASDNNAYWTDDEEGAGAGSSFWYYNE